MCLILMYTIIIETFEEMLPHWPHDPLETYVDIPVCSLERRRRDGYTRCVICSRTIPRWRVVKEFNVNSHKRKNAHYDNENSLLPMGWQNFIAIAIRYYRWVNKFTFQCDIYNMFKLSLPCLDLSYFKEKRYILCIIIIIIFRL